MAQLMQHIGNQDDVVGPGDFVSQGICRYIPNFVLECICQPDFLCDFQNLGKIQEVQLKLRVVYTCRLNAKVPGPQPRSSRLLQQLSF